MIFLFLVACNDNTLDNAIEPTTISSKDHWSLEQKKSCREEYWTKLQSSNEMKLKLSLLSNQLFNTSVQNLADCFCDSAESKFNDFKRFENINDFEYDKLKTHAFITQVNDSSVKNNWSDNMKNLCSKSLRIFSKNLFENKNVDKENQCVCEELEKKYNNFWDITEAIISDFYNQEDLMDEYKSCFQNTK